MKFCTVLLVSMTLANVASAQRASQATSLPEFDGLISAEHFKSIEGKSIALKIKGRNGKVTESTGQLIEVMPTRRGASDLRMLNITQGRRKRRFKIADIQSLSINKRKMEFRYLVPGKKVFLVDQQLALAAAKPRLAKEKAKLMPPTKRRNFDTMTAESKQYIEAALKTLAAPQIRMEESPEVILLTDLPEQASTVMLAKVTAFSEELNELFGVPDMKLLGPGKPIIAAFLDRQLLATFEMDVIQFNNFGESNAMIHEYRNRTIIAVEDSRSPNHLLWQTAWGLSGIYIHYSHSDLELPLWLKRGIQMQTADVLVPGISNRKTDLMQARMLTLPTGSLNGLMEADDIPINRHVLCKTIVSHLQSASEPGFRQFFQQVKLGLPVSDAIQRTYGTPLEDFIVNYGTTVGVRGLQP